MANVRRENEAALARLWVSRFVGLACCGLNIRSAAEAAETHVCCGREQMK